MKTKTDIQAMEVAELQEELIETTRALAMAVREVEVLTTMLAWSTPHVAEYAPPHAPAAYCPKDQLPHTERLELLREVLEESRSRRELVSFDRVDLWLIEASIK